MMPKKQSSVISENDLMMYLATGLKHIRLMALLLCFAILLALSYFLFSRSVYKSNALIQVRTIDQPVTTEGLWHNMNDRTITGVMNGPEVTKRVAKRLGLPTSPSELDRHLKRVRIYRNSEKDFIVEVFCYSYAVARDWAPVMLQEYQTYRDERQLMMAENAITTFQTQMSELREKIGQNVDAKFYYSQSNDVDKVLMQLQELREVPKALLIARQRLTSMQHIREMLDDPNRSVADRLSLIASLETDPTTKLAAGLPDRQLSLTVGLPVPLPGSGVSTQEDSDIATSSGVPANNIIVLPSSQTAFSTKPWEKLERDRAAILQEVSIQGQKYLAGHPKMAELKHRLDDVDRQLDLEYGIALNGFNVEYENLVSKKTQLEKQLSQYDEISRRNEKTLKEWRQLDTVKTALDSIYNKLSKKITTVDFGQDKDRNEFNFRGYLDLRDKPISPIFSSCLMYGIIMGLALAIGIPFLLEYLNSRVSDIEHAEETLRIRGLGVVPKIVEVPMETLLLEEETTKTDYHLKENFRLIRTNLIINSENAALPQVILVTSAMPQEGKTSVSANLAMSFASKGEKTLLIDGDLRRGRAYKLFAVHNKPGLSNVLKNEVTLEDALRPTTVDHLTVLPCGKHLNSASELLDSHRFSNLMAELRSRYQRIILDSPPVLGLSETIIMQRFTDGIMLVIWSDFTPMNSVKAAVQTLSVNGAKFLGFVLNRLDFSTLGNRYKYFYYAPLYYTNYQPLPPPPSPAPAGSSKT